MVVLWFSYVPVHQPDMYRLWGFPTRAMRPSPWWNMPQSWPSRALASNGGVAASKSTSWMETDVVNSQVAMENGHLWLIYIDLLWKIDENMWEWPSMVDLHWFTHWKWWLWICSFWRPYGGVYGPIKIQYYQEERMGIVEKNAGSKWIDIGNSHFPDQRCNKNNPPSTCRWICLISMYSNLVQNFQIPFSHLFPSN